MFKEDALEKSFKVFALTMMFIVSIFGLFELRKQSVNFDQDKQSIVRLSSFTVKDNPNVQSDYDKLAAYKPKTDDGDKLKSEKMSQKINEIRSFENK